MRVIADHLRAMTFLIAVCRASNEWRGTCCGRSCAVRCAGKKLGFREPVLHELIEVVVREMESAYSELPQSRRILLASAVRRSASSRATGGFSASRRRSQGRRVGRPMSGDEAFRSTTRSEFRGIQGTSRPRKSRSTTQIRTRMEGQREGTRRQQVAREAEKALALTMAPDLERKLEETETN